jgi:pyrroline-5-carboxylate reductase
MGQALIKGLLAAGVSAKRILAVEANPPTRQVVARRYKVRVSSLHEVATRCDVIVLAVKPQDLGQPLVELRGRVRLRRTRSLVISIAAGVPIRTLERSLGRWPVARVMPNLAAKVGCAISAIAAGRFATSAHRAIAKEIFQCVGEVVELPERLFDVVTAISGSGPAYFFLIFKALRDAGVKGGLPQPIAERLAVHTALGSVHLVNGSTDDLESMMTQVASKKGTTEAALKVFARRRLAEILQAGVRAAARRSKELRCLSWRIS